MRERLYSVTVLLAHNARKGKRKAPDVTIEIPARDALHAKDIVERGEGPEKKGRLPGIKCVIAVEPVGMREMSG